MRISDQLRDQLTPILEVADLRDAWSQFEGPCPICKTGTNRFSVKKSSTDRYYYRQCNGKGQGGSLIDFHMRFGGHATMMDLADAMSITCETTVAVSQPMARVFKENLTATYEYKNEDRETLFYVGRYEEPGRRKTFSQWRI